MEIFNADGSTAEMCGNGIRAVALYLKNHFFQDRNEFQIETLAGLKQVQIQGEQVQVDMGVPELGPGFSTQGEILSIDQQEFRFFEVNVGNPHAVIFVPELAGFPIDKWGPRIEVHPRFPTRTNVEFVEVKSPNQIQVRVWERGAGITLACGTGACAAAVASRATGRVSSPLKVKLPGGILNLVWPGPGSSILMQGPATEVFSGRLNLAALS
jgi:diaminopimelate epimerase